MLARVQCAVHQLKRLAVSNTILSDMNAWKRYVGILYQFASPWLYPCRCIGGVRRTNHYESLTTGEPDVDPQSAGLLRGSSGAIGLIWAISTFFLPPEQMRRGWETQVVCWSACTWHVVGAWTRCRVCAWQEFDSSFVCGIASVQGRRRGNSGSSR